MDLKCQNKACGKTFNQTTREPLMMSCCGESVCKECISITTNTEEETYKCPCCSNENMKHIKPSRNLMLKRLLSKLQQVCINCDEHQDQRAEYYCMDHKQMICNQCAIKTHADHFDNCRQLNCDDFEIFCHAILKNLTEEQKRISKMIEDLMGYFDQGRVFSSKEFLAMINDSMQSIASQVRDKEQQNILNYLGDISAISAIHKSILTIQNAIQLTFLPENKPQLQLENLIIQLTLPLESDLGVVPLPELLIMPESFKIDSKILKPAVDMPLIQEWLGNSQNFKLELLYRGSRDGYTAQEFHSRCDNKGATITFVKSEYRKVFGGYTSIPWISKSYTYLADDKAFLFSLTHKTKHLQYRNQAQAVFHQSSYMSTFGGGYDLTICDNCRADNESYCDLGCTYQQPQGMKYQSDEAVRYMAGCLKFKVAEIEVFQVLYDVND